MIQISKKENEDLFSPYFSDYVEIVPLEKLDAFPAFTAILEEHNVPLTKALIGKLLSGYQLTGTIVESFVPYIAVCNQPESQSIKKELRNSFKQLAQEIIRYVLHGYKIGSSFSFYEKKKEVADFLQKVFSLRVDKMNSNQLLIYNHKRGIWEKETVIVQRFILELFYFIAGNDGLQWSKMLETVIFNILERTVPVVEIPMNCRYFPFANKTLDSQNGEFIEHSLDHYALIGSRLFVDGEAECPRFIQFLGEVFPDDEETICSVQELFGYCLSNSYRANVFPIFVGDGANGKSTLLHPLEQIIGVENVSSIALSNFGSEFGLEPVLGKKLNISTENGVQGFQTEKIKAITAGEMVSVNRKNKQEIATVLPTKFIFSMNGLPIQTDSSYGFARRCVIYPFEVTFLPDQQDRFLSEALSQETAGILNWAVKGLKRLIQQDFSLTVSPVMEQAKTAYFHSNNKMSIFVGSCVKASDTVCEAKEIIAAYTSWMGENDYPLLGSDSPRVFWKKFETATGEKGIQYKKSKSNGKTVVKGIAII